MESYVVEKSIFMNGRDAASCFIGVAFGLFLFSKSFSEFFVGTVITMVCFLLLSSPSDIVEKQLVQYTNGGHSISSTLLTMLTWPLLWCSLVVLISLTKYWGLAVTILYCIYVLVTSKNKVKYITAFGILSIFFTANRFVQRSPEWLWFHSFLSNAESFANSDCMCYELAPHISATYWASVLSVILIILLFIERKSIFTQSMLSSPLTMLFPAPYIATYDIAYYWLRGYFAKLIDVDANPTDNVEIGRVSTPESVHSNKDLSSSSPSRTSSISPPPSFSLSSSTSSISTSKTNQISFSHIEHYYEQETRMARTPSPRMESFQVSDAESAVFYRRKSSGASVSNGSTNASTSQNRPRTRSYSSSISSSRNHSNSFKS